MAKTSFREYKFKVWDITSEKMEYNIYPTRESHANSNLIFMLNTGMIDKEKNDIYERDLIEFEYKGRKLVGEVKYIPGKYVARVKDSDIDYISWKESLDTVKVIGNYYLSKWYQK